MDFTSITPTKPGVYMARRSGYPDTVCKIAEIENSGRLSIEFLGDARCRGTQLAEKIFSGMQYSSETVDGSMFKEVQIESSEGLSDSSDEDVDKDVDKDDDGDVFESDYAGDEGDDTFESD